MLYYSWDMNNTATETKIHAFEKAGLGKAPFRFVGQIHQDIAYGQAVISPDLMITTKPGGTCDYCGTYILNMFRIVSSDGRTFKVGSDCVAKTGDAGLIRKVAAVVKTATAKRTAERNAAKIETLKAQLADETIRAKLAVAQAPSSARTTWSLISYADWMIVHAGTAGKIKVAGLVNKLLVGE